MKQKTLSSILVVLVMLSIVAIDAFAYGNTFQELNPSDYEAPQVIDVELLPDPLLNGSQSVTIVGSSDNFVWDHSFGAYNNLSLIWNHTAGDAVNYRLPSEITPDLPDTNDFIYMEQSFEWPYNEWPGDFEIRSEVSVEFQYDFDYFTARDYFRYYIWVIDSSGDWIMLRESNYYSIYPSNFVTINADPNYMMNQRIWGGMIEDEFGHQEDPSDTVRVAIGLAPTFAFENDTDTLTGSVTLKIGSLSAITSYDEIVDDLVTPTYEGHIDAASQYFLGLESAPDGSLYSVQTVSSYETQTGNIIIQKWSPTCVPLWSGYMSGPQYNYARDFVVTDDGSVIVLGYERPTSEGARSTPMIASWNPDGLLSWKILVNSLQDYHVNRLCLTSDGSILIGGNYDNYTSESTWVYMAKISLSGEILWLSDWDGYGYDYIAQIIPASDGSFVTRSAYGDISRFDNNGNRLQIIDPIDLYINIRSIDLDSYGNIYYSYVDYGYPHSDNTGLNIAKLDSSGISLWNSSWGRDWDNALHGIWEGVALKVANDGSIFVAGQTGFNGEIFYIVKWDSSGNVTTSVAWSYENMYFSMPTYDNYDILAIGDNGLVYFPTFTADDTEALFRVNGFQIGPVSLISISDPGVKLVMTFTFSSIALAALILFAKKRDLIDIPK